MFGIDEKLCRIAVGLPDERRLFSEGIATVRRVGKIRTDHIVLKRLDVNNISVISAVLAQTVALEHYEHKVDAMVEIFSKLNKSTELTGDLNISKKRLFSLVAENNNTLTELITRLGLLGRSDTAWQYAQYNTRLGRIETRFRIGRSVPGFGLQVELDSNASEVLFGDFAE